MNLNGDETNSAILSHDFLEVSFLDANDLSQTATTSNQASGNTLYLLITSKLENIIYVNQKEPFAPTCDHNMIEFKFHQTSFMNI